MQNKVWLSYTEHQSHSCRADKNPYWHDGRADKDTYRQDGRVYSLSRKIVILTACQQFRLSLALKCISL